MSPGWTASPQVQGVGQECPTHTSWLADMDSVGLCSLTSAMQRVTARLVLLFLLASAFAPVLQALSAEPPHACCLRKLHSSAGRGASIHGSARTDGNCCPPMTTSQSGQVLGGKVTFFLAHSSDLQLEPLGSWHGAGYDSNNSSRAPPVFVLS